MNRQFMNNARLLLLAIVFSVGILFAFIELSGLLDASVQNNLGDAFSELEDKNVEIRRNAVIVCIQSGDQRAIEPLKRLFGDDDFDKVLCQTGSEKAGI